MKDAPLTNLKLSVKISALNQQSNYLTV